MLLLAPACEFFAKRVASRHVAASSRLSTALLGSWHLQRFNFNFVFIVEAFVLDGLVLLGMALEYFLIPPAFLAVRLELEAHTVSMSFMVSSPCAGLA